MYLPAALAETLEDEASVLDIVRRSVRFYEQAMPHPWSFDGGETGGADTDGSGAGAADAGGADPFFKRLLAQIVGFRIEVEKIDGKWKLNQNHPRERREKVVRALQESGDASARAVGELMRERLAGGAPEGESPPS
ncbi:MAG: hypothetical protein HYS13_25045 [Planctomycetia bacterium]|nr:hypothetical protein [Planctomycetia bacterium]